MNRTLGATLLVIGITVGAGILALPVISTFSGFFPSSLVILGCWGLLFTTGLFMIEVNLACPGESNLISMAGKTLGNWGRIATWILTLLLLYSLLTAYIAGSSSFFAWLLPRWATPLPLLALLGTFVYLGTAQSDRLNRILIVVKAATFLILIALLPSHLEPSLLLHTDAKASLVAIPVTITAFGFHNIIPTISTYLNHDRRRLRKALLLGTMIPLGIYLLWNFLVMGSVPLAALAQSYREGTTAAPALVSILKNPWIALAASSFPFISILTSFLGVSLSLSDFLTDGLHLRRFSLSREIAAFLTFIPPFVFFLINPHLFISALSYGGMFVALLLGALPALMAWNLPQYRKRRPLLATVVGLSLFVVVLDLMEEAGMFHSLIAPYLN